MANNNTINEIATKSNNLNIDSLTTGISLDGMDKYVENLKLSLLEDTVDKLNECEAMVAAINNCWQGKSRDQFIKDLNAARQQINDNLIAEFNDLNNRLIDLTKQYFQQDLHLYDR